MSGAMSGAARGAATWRGRALALMEEREIRARRAGGLEWRDARLGDGMRLALRHDPMMPEAPARLEAFLLATPQDPSRRQRALALALELNRARAAAWGYGARLVDGMDSREGEHLALAWRLDGRTRADARSFALALRAFLGRARKVRASWLSAASARPDTGEGLRL